ncbi:MAG TPA: aminotransferase class V-fold PLP-dependent enzyme, partial [Candidatus Dormibacteraeota bacterium]
QHELGVTVAVDGAHAAASVALDVAAVGADYYIANLHKWCCAPRGVGFVAVDEGSRAAFRPAVVGSRWDEGFPAAMEWWGTADYSALLCAPSALDMLDRLGVLRVRDHGQRLAAWGQGIVAAALGTTPQRLPHAAMALVPLPPGIADTRPEARRLREVIADRLAAEVVVVAHGGRGYLRLSAHVYNRPGDYERLAAGLPQVLGDAAGPATATERSGPVG